MSTKLDADHYFGRPVDARQGRDFAAWDRRGYTSIEVLPFLVGKPWDNFALAYVHALRPSRVRVVRDSVQLDARVWRVTVWVNEDDTIKWIEQEVEVGLPESVEHGAALDALFR